MRVLFLFLFTLLTGCWGDNAYIVEGTVVEVNGTNEVVVAHKAIEGLGMDAMTMPFAVRNPKMLEGVEPGHLIYARMIIDESGAHLEKIRVTGMGVVPKTEPPPGPAPLKIGEQLPAVQIALADGSSMTLGAGQDKPTAVSFFYTRCPMPDFCPALTLRMQQLQEALGDRAHLLLVTLDPEVDSDEVLMDYAGKAGADPAIWRFARLQKAQLDDLAMRAALQFAPDGTEIAHAKRVLVLDADGKLLERYDDFDFAQGPRRRAAHHRGSTRSGAGKAGTLTPK